MSVSCCLSYDRNIITFVTGICYNILHAKEKQATAQQAFVFLACSNEQTSDEIGQEARQREFASKNASLTASVTRIASQFLVRGCAAGICFSCE